MRPWASTRWAVVSISGAISAISPSLMRMSVGAAPRIRAPLMTYVLIRAPRADSFGAPDRGFRAAEQQVEDGHADGDAVADLLDDGRPARVRDLRSDPH